MSHDYYCDGANHSITMIIMLVLSYW